MQDAPLSIPSLDHHTSPVNLVAFPDASPQTRHSLKYPKLTEGYQNSANVAEGVNVVLLMPAIMLVYLEWLVTFEAVPDTFALARGLRYRAAYMFPLYIVPSLHVVLLLMNIFFLAYKEKVGRNFMIAALVLMILNWLTMNLLIFSDLLYTFPTTTNTTTGE